MTKTSLDVITRALRDLGVCSLVDDPSAEDAAHARTAMQGALDELRDQHGLPGTWTIEQVPDELFLPMAALVAAEVKGVYRFSGPSRSGAIGRIRAALLPDDREDRRDTDEDGVLTEAEIEAGKRAAYF